MRTLGVPEGREWPANQNPALLLSIAQRLPISTRNINWDHIFPAAQTTRMWAISEYNRRMHHPYRRLQFSGQLLGAGQQHKPDPARHVAAGEVQ